VSGEPAYDDGDVWRAGPDRIYGRLAAASVDTLGGPLDGRLALDAGAGTGAVTRALARRGARVVPVDLSASMLKAARARPGAVADVRRLPFAGAAFDLAAAGFVLSHLPDPDTALAELARVTRSGGTVLATAFPAGRRHPVKVAVDEVLAATGYRDPDWYLDLKESGEVRIGTAAALAALAVGAGLSTPVVDEVAVDLAGLDAPALAAWRLGMAQVAPFVAGLGEERRQALVADATAAAAGAGGPQPLPILVLRGEIG
jgi:SAM-dependent methyltransferase